MAVYGPICSAQARTDLESVHKAAAWLWLVTGFNSQIKQGQTISLAHVGIRVIHGDRVAGFCGACHFSPVRPHFANKRGCSARN